MRSSSLLNRRGMQSPTSVLRSTTSCRRIASRVVGRIGIAGARAETPRRGRSAPLTASWLARPATPLAGNGASARTLSLPRRVGAVSAATVVRRSRPGIAIQRRHGSQGRNTTRGIAAPPFLLRSASARSTGLASQLALSGVEGPRRGSRGARRAVSIPRTRGRDDVGSGRRVSAVTAQAKNGPAAGAIGGGADSSQAFEEASWPNRCFTGVRQTPSRRRIVSRAAEGPFSTARSRRPGPTSSRPRSRGTPVRSRRRRGRDSTIPNARGLGAGAPARDERSGADSFRAGADRRSSSRSCRQRHLRLGAGAGGRRGSAAADRRSRPAAIAAGVRSPHPRRPRLARVPGGPPPDVRVPVRRTLPAGKARGTASTGPRWRRFLRGA